MEVKVKAYPLSGKGNELANLSIEMGGELVIRARLVQGKNGPFVSMPSMRSKDGFKDLVYPVSKELRDEINRASAVAYNDAVSKKQQRSQKQSGYTGMSM